MNERIRELAEQARCFTETYDNELLSEPALLYCFHEDDFEKFAELIIRECARSVTWYTKQELAGVNRGQVFRANKTVLEHFGVEE